MKKQLLDIQFVVIIVATLILLSVIGGCKAEESVKPAIRLSTEEEKETFARKSENDRYKELGVSRIEISVRNHTTSDTSSKLREIYYLDLAGEVKYHVMMEEKDTIITLYKWNSQGKTTALHRYKNGNLKDSVFCFYDSKGNIMEVDSNGASKNFANIYDKKGRLFQVVTAVASSGDVVVQDQYTYNEDGSFLLQTRPMSETGEYYPPLYLQHDSKGRLITITWQGVPIRRDLEYDKYGYLIRDLEFSQAGEGATWEYSYDQFFNLILMVKKDASGKVEEETFFKYIYRQIDGK